MTFNDVDGLSENLPEVLAEVTKPFETKEEKLVALTATIVETGALLPEVWFSFDNSKTFPMPMLTVTAPPASGKGILKFPKQLMSLIDAKLRKDGNEKKKEYAAEVRRIKVRNQTEEKKLPLPEYPKTPRLLVPGDITQPELVRQLSVNGSENPILMYELEADSFGKTGNGQYGIENSTILRQLFHFEDVSQARKLDEQNYYVEKPKGVVIFAGTPSQIFNIFKSNQDGLYSRFMFLTMEGAGVFRDVFEEKEETNDDYFSRLAPYFFDLWEYFRGREVRVRFSSSQKTKIGLFGKEYYSKTHNFMIEEADSVAVRHTNTLMRMATILRMFRYFDEKDTAQEVVCTDQDVEIATKIARVSIRNALDVFEQLPGGEKVPFDNVKKLRLWEDLPKQFKKKDLSERLEKMNIPDRTFYNWIRKFVKTGLLERLSRGEYRKTALALVAERQNGFKRKK